MTSINAKYPDFANSSDMTIRKREAAAYLANFSLETGDGVYIRETIAVSSLQRLTGRPSTSVMRSPS